MEWKDIDFYVKTLSKYQCPIWYVSDIIIKQYSLDTGRRTRPEKFVVLLKQITPYQFIESLHIVDLFTGTMEANADFNDTTFYNVNTNKFYSYIEAVPDSLFAQLAIKSNLENGTTFKPLENTNDSTLLTQRSCVARMASRFIKDVEEGHFQELYNDNVGTKKKHKKTKEN